LAKFGKARIPPCRKKISRPNPNNCLRYWDLADHIRIDDAIALWCGVEPAELSNRSTRRPRSSGWRPGQDVNFHPAQGPQAWRQQGGCTTGWPSRGAVQIGGDFLQAKRRIETALAEKVADFGRFG
jgi:hypothetical protein